jgi:hypothetical protein
MPGRPNITSVELDAAGDRLVVLGETDAPLPREIQIYLEHGGVLSRGSLSDGDVRASWSLDMDGNGFKRGDTVNSVGLEIRTRQFQATAWTQDVVIE